MTENLGQADALGVNHVNLLQEGHSDIRKPLDVDIKQDYILNVDGLLNRRNQASLRPDIQALEALVPPSRPPQAAVNEAVSALLEVGKRLNEQCALLLDSFKSRYLS